MGEPYQTCNQPNRWAEKHFLEPGSIPASRIRHQKTSKTGWRAYRCREGIMGNMGHEGVREIMKGVAGNMGHEGVREIYGQVPVTITTLHLYQSTGLNPTPPNRHRPHSLSQQKHPHERQQTMGRHHPPILQKLLSQKGTSGTDRKYSLNCCDVKN